jgi:osmotically-inducible protein OsmY
VSRALKLVIVLAAMASVAACATEARRTLAERVADQELAARVEQALLRDPQIYARHVDVETDHGVVRLSGYVWSADDLYRARHLAATVPGVTAVVSQLEITVGGRTGAR